MKPAKITRFAERAARLGVPVVVETERGELRGRPEPSPFWVRIDGEIVLFREVRNIGFDFDSPAGRDLLAHQQA